MKRLKCLRGSLIQVNPNGSIQCKNNGEKECPKENNKGSFDKECLLGN